LLLHKQSELKMMKTSQLPLAARSHSHDSRQLNLSEWRREQSRVRWPSFNPCALEAGILHFGCGVFHRAHQNVFTQRAIELERQTSSAWGVLGVSFRGKQAKQLLAPQDFLYTVLEREQDRTIAEVVGVLKGILFAQDEQEAVIAAIKRPQTRIITLTITPSGYLTPEPDRNPPSRQPPDAIGLLVAGLAAVRVKGTPPPVLISCDNIPGNGRQLRRALVNRARSCSPSLGSWIDRNVQFPSSVVDRIVPTPTSADSAAASGLLGISDLAAVGTEPFRQWIIENFDGPRPPWASAGAEFVSDVSPWEESKLRLLNGTHMAIAFTGLLAGHKTVSDTVLDPPFGRFACRLMIDEQVPSIAKSDHDLHSYCDQLLRRWRNVTMMHQLDRIARHGSEKLHPRLIASLSRNMADGRAAPCTILAVAAWICCTGRLMPTAAPIEDKAKDEIQQAASCSGGDTRRLVQLLLPKAEIFGRDASRSPALEQQLSNAVQFLRLHGIRRAVSRVLEIPRGSSW
jgi:fructuronate reductase